jgi:hypothetical protein
LGDGCNERHRVHLLLGCSSLHRQLQCSKLLRTQLLFESVLWSLYQCCTMYGVYKTWWNSYHLQGSSWPCSFGSTLNMSVSCLTTVSGYCSTSRLDDPPTLGDDFTALPDAPETSKSSLLFLLTVAMSSLFKSSMRGVSPNDSGFLY